MTTRRQVLGWAGLVGLGAVAGCATASVPAVPDDLLVLEGPDGVSVLSTASGQPLVPAGPAVLSADGLGLARAEAAGGSTRLFSHRLPRGEEVFSGTVSGALTPRVVAPGGALVALADPGSSTHHPGRRDRTTLVVADGAGQRARLELDGNLEPEAFDPSGRLLYVLDYVPPVRPDRYRVRIVDLATGRIQPLQTRDKTPVPAGAEEEMRGEGRQAVYDKARDILFTLYTHQPDHEHTRDLIAGGARAGAPDVHAFVHSLHLGGQWAFCVDLPAPFGAESPAGHAIARDPSGAVVVVDAGAGAVAVIDPDGLVVRETSAFPRASGAIEGATALFGPDRELLVAAGHDLMTRHGARWSTDQPIHGAAFVGDRLWVAVDGAAIQVDPATGAERHRLTLPSGGTLRGAFTR
jgi:hypothetical protein